MRGGLRFFRYQHGDNNHWAKSESIDSKDDEIKTTEDGTSEVNENGATFIAGVFAGGDITPGTTTAIKAMSAGKRDEGAIHEYIS